MKVTARLNPVIVKLLMVLLIAVAGTAALVAYRGMHRVDDGVIKVSGNIELTQVDIAFKTSGRLIERAVNEGSSVQKGMVVARLDREQLLRQRDREKAALAMAEAQLSQTDSALQWQEETFKAELEARQADLSSSSSRLLELKNGSRPQEIQEGKAAVEAAQAEFDRAKRDWDRAQTLYKNDDISTSQFDQFRGRFESAQATLRQATQRSALVQAGPRSEIIEGASAQVMRARAAVKGSEANRLELQRRRQEIAARHADIDRAKAQIALIDSQLADTVVVSPIAGVVLVAAADTGEVVAPGTAVLTIGDIEHPWLRAYINERDLGRVNLGSSVRVRTDSFPGKIYNGKVSFISSEAEFTPKQIQTTEERVKLVYRIKIELDNSRHELKSNMPADAEILTGG